MVYAAFGSDCDFSPWQGWVFGVSTAGEVKARWVALPSGDGAGIWQSGAGLMSDGAGTSSDAFVAERKRVNRYGLPTSGSVTKLNVYLAPTGTAGQQVLKGVVYADSNGAPGALLGVS